jgi:hypothetical protein
MDREREFIPQSPNKEADDEDGFLKVIPGGTKFPKLPRHEITEMFSKHPILVIGPAPPQIWNEEEVYNVLTISPETMVPVHGKSLYSFSND